MRRQPNPKITNAAKREERRYYRHLPRKSRRLKEARLLAIRQDCSLSVAQKKQLFLVTKYRVVFTDRTLPLVAIGGRYYKQTAAGYLSELTHRNGDPVLTDLGSEGE
jgi:hypothetical protein